MEKETTYSTTGTRLIKSRVCKKRECKEILSLSRKSVLNEEGEKLKKKVRGKCGGARKKKKIMKKKPKKK